MSSTPPIPAPGLREMLSRCVCLNVRKAARAVTRLYDEELADSGALSTQLPLLVTVALHGPLNTTELADEVVMDRTAVSRNLTRLEREGWVRMEPGREDRRTREASLTEEGWEVVARAMPLWRAVQDEVAEHLGEAGLESLISDLQTVLEATRS